MCVCVKQDNLSLAALSIHEPLFREGAGESDASCWWFFRVCCLYRCQVRWVVQAVREPLCSSQSSCHQSVKELLCYILFFPLPLLLSYLHTHLMKRKTSRVQPGSCFPL